MKRWLTFGIVIWGLLIDAPAQDLPSVPRERVDAVDALIGPSLTAEPSQTRRLLVFWKCEGFVHGDSIAMGNKALRIVAKKTKAFALDLSNEYEALRPDNLARYDALVLNNTTGLKTALPENAFIEPALLDFVRSGKGLAVIHAGADNFYKAPACAEMVGGLFNLHPWGASGTWSFRVEEPDHPCCAFSLKPLAPTFKFSDEIYQHRSPFYNRAKLRVLVSMNLSDKRTASVKSMRRTDNDYAVSWVRPFGKGRVFYTSFAHDHRAWLRGEILRHILDGIQYAIGDLKADDTPHGLSEKDLAYVGGVSSEEGGKEVQVFLHDILTHTGVTRVDDENRMKLRQLMNNPTTTEQSRKIIADVLQQAR